MFANEPEYIKAARQAMAKTKYDDRKHSLTKPEAQAARKMEGKK